MSASAGGERADRPFSPEFRLCLDCCKTAFAECGTAVTGEILPGVDWSQLIRLVRYHRVQGLVWNALRSYEEIIPTECKQGLAGDARTIAMNSLTASAESRELLHSFRSAAIPLLFLKGLTLAARAYGNTALKSAIDIDLLIDPRDLGSAAQLLRQAGYHLLVPNDSPDDEVLQSWHGRSKESVWAKTTPPVQIDLHTRTADNRRLIPSIDVHSPQLLVEVGAGTALPTLALDELFAYLAVHGASSAWFRLKWISDFAALVASESADEIGRLYRRSQELGAGRAAGQALLLANELFGTLTDAPELRDELRRDRATRSLFRTALRLVSGEPSEPTERRWGTLAIHRTQFLLLPGLDYELSELSRQVATQFTRFVN